MEDSNQQQDTDTLLRKEGWYLGELNEEAGRTVLETSGKYNVFIVHKTDDGGYILSARFPVEGTQDGVVEHLSIIEEGEGRMRIERQDTVHNSLKEAVTDYTCKRDPPLSPALCKRDLEAQSSVVSNQAPPTYDLANKQLQPDIAPLPKIDNVTTDIPVEAKTGRISPTGSLQYNRYDSYLHQTYGHDQVDAPPYMSNPHWYRYRDKSCCHPKNTWHCCCHRDTYWDGESEVKSFRAWYNCRGTGFCRCLLLILIWLFCWPFVLIFLCCFGCFWLCYTCYHYVRYDYDDDD